VAVRNWRRYYGCRRQQSIPAEDDRHRFVNRAVRSSELVIDAPRIVKESSQSCSDYTMRQDRAHIRYRLYAYMRYADDILWCPFYGCCPRHELCVSGSTMYDVARRQLRQDVNYRQFKPQMKTYLYAIYWHSASRISAFVRLRNSHNPGSASEYTDLHGNLNGGSGRYNKSLRTTTY